MGLLLVMNGCRDENGEEPSSRRISLSFGNNGGKDSLYLADLAEWKVVGIKNNNTGYYLHGDVYDEANGFFQKRNSTQNAFLELENEGALEASSDGFGFFRVEKEARLLRISMGRNREHGRQDLSVWLRKGSVETEVRVEMSPMDYFSVKEIDYNFDETCSDSLFWEAQTDIQKAYDRPSVTLLWPLESAYTFSRFEFENDSLAWVPCDSVVMVEAPYGVKDGVPYFLGETIPYSEQGYFDKENVPIDRQETYSCGELMGNVTIHRTVEYRMITFTYRLTVENLSDHTLSFYSGKLVRKVPTGRFQVSVTKEGESN